jgi:hypothetical protein
MKYSIKGVFLMVTIGRITQTTALYQSTSNEVFLGFEAVLSMILKISPSRLMTTFTGLFSK